MLGWGRFIKVCGCCSVFLFLVGYLYYILNGVQVGVESGPKNITYTLKTLRQYHHNWGNYVCIHGINTHALLLISWSNFQSDFCSCLLMQHKFPQDENLINRRCRTRNTNRVTPAYLIRVSAPWLSSYGEWMELKQRLLMWGWCILLHSHASIRVMKEEVSSDNLFKRFLTDLLPMQHKFPQDVKLINRRWRTRKTTLGFRVSTPPWLVIHQLLWGWWIAT